ncbi:uncharacterized protein LOC113799225 [Dermatophagoides pteronyssinus]|uniref:uncharacterized protein LOC113799225 n=1 Tax=Dermatophagoides pteronyssinus TaxID=6956 RepID=UPI003F66E7C8
MTDQQQQQSSSSTKLTTEIMESRSDFTINTDNWPEYKRNVLGLLYLDDFDGEIDEINESNQLIELPLQLGNIDPNKQPQYQCIKCGKIQTNELQTNDIHRMKCLRCYNKAFNKIRSTKWIKFHAY